MRYERSTAVATVTKKRLLVYALTAFFVFLRTGGRLLLRQQVVLLVVAPKY